MDLAILIRTGGGDVLGPRVPCPACGLPILQAWPDTVVSAFFGEESAVPRAVAAIFDGGLEQHQRAAADTQGVELHLRQHTPERCARVRAGRPEPVDWMGTAWDDPDVNTRHVELRATQLWPAYPRAPSEQ